MLKNDHFLQLLMTDDVETATAMMSVLRNILRVNRFVTFKSFYSFFLFLNLTFKNPLDTEFWKIEAFVYRTRAVSVL